MKLLLDSCVSGRARDELVAAGHDVVWAGDWLPAGAIVTAERGRLGVRPPPGIE